MATSVKASATKPTTSKGSAKGGVKAAVKAAVARKLLGNPKDGVRAHPSYDHPGEFYAVEATTRRRVFSGYHSVDEIRAWCRKGGVKFLGVVNVTGEGSGSGYNKAKVAEAVGKYGATVRRATAKVATKPANGKSKAAKVPAKPVAKPTPPIDVKEMVAETKPETAQETAAEAV